MSLCSGRWRLFARTLSQVVVRLVQGEAWCHADGMAQPETLSQHGASISRCWPRVETTFSTRLIPHSTNVFSWLWFNRSLQKTRCFPDRYWASCALLLSWANSGISRTRLPGDVQRPEIIGQINEALYSLLRESVSL